MLEAGNPLGQLTFSRENEAQADRLAVHIARDAGDAPEGLVGSRVDVALLAQRLGPDDAHAPVLDRSGQRRVRMDYIIVLSYYGREALFDKYAPAFELIGESLHYRGR